MTAGIVDFLYYAACQQYPDLKPEEFGDIAREVVAEMRTDESLCVSDMLLILNDRLKARFGEPKDACRP